MAKGGRTTFAKLQRERARMEKQRLKREARLERSAEPTEAQPEEEFEVIDPNDPAYIARMAARAEAAAEVLGEVVPAESDS
jgi:hypothetical protein